MLLRTHRAHTSVFAASLLLAPALVGCQGSDGPEGPIGPEGPEGSEGPEGPPGEDASDAPRVESVAPPQGSWRSRVTVSGDGFAAEAEDNEVWLGSHRVEVVSASESELVVDPEPVYVEEPRTVEVTVISNGVASNTTLWEVVPSGHETVLDLPAYVIAADLAADATGETVYLSDVAHGIHTIDAATGRVEREVGLGSELDAFGPVAYDEATGGLFVGGAKLVEDDGDFGPLDAPLAAAQVDVADEEAALEVTVVHWHPETGELGIVVPPAMLQEGELEAIAAREGEAYVAIRDGGDVGVIAWSQELGVSPFATIAASDVIDAAIVDDALVIASASASAGGGGSLFVVPLDDPDEVVEQTIADAPAPLSGFSVEPAGDRVWLSFEDGALADAPTEGVGGSGDLEPTIQLEGQDAPVDLLVDGLAVDTEGRLYRGSLEGIVRAQPEGDDVRFDRPFPGTFEFGLAHPAILGERIYHGAALLALEQGFVDSGLHGVYAFDKTANSYEQVWDEGIALSVTEGEGGELLVGEIAEGEVLTLDPATGETDVLLDLGDGAPTSVLLDGDTLYVAYADFGEDGFVEGAEPEAQFLARANADGTGLEEAWVELGDIAVDIVSSRGRLILAGRPLASDFVAAVDPEASEPAPEPVPGLEGVADEPLAVVPSAESYLVVDPGAGVFEEAATGTFWPLFETPGIFAGAYDARTRGYEFLQFNPLAFVGVLGLDLGASVTDGPVEFFQLESGWRSVAP